MTIDVSLIPQNRVENLISKLSEIENNIGNIGTDITNNLVHKSGNETISGEKTFTSYTHFTSSEPKLVFKSSVMDITQSGWTAGRNSIAWCEDKNGYESGGIYNNISNDDKVVTSLYAISRKSGKQQSSFIRVGVDGLGNAFTEAPHPTTAQDSSNKIATTAWVNNLDNSVVHKAGNETISGDKTFTNPISITTTADEARFITTFTDVSLDTNPTTNIYNGFKSVDSNGVEFANCNCSYNTAGRIGSNFWVNRNDSGTSVSGGMGIYIDKNGTSAYTQAPTPASGDNSTKIATTNWCYDPAKSTNLVHRTGNETINGKKTFTGELNKVGSARFNAIVINDTSYDYLTNPSEDLYNHIVWRDKNNKDMSYVQQLIDTNGNVHLYYVASNYKTDGTRVNCYIGCNVSRDGGIWTDAPTPATSDNSTKIATTNWVRTLGFIPNYSRQMSISLPYTAPANGFISGVLTAAHSENYYIKVNNIQVQRIYGETNQRVTAPFFIPVYKGDVISTTGGTNTVYFYYAR